MCLYCRELLLRLRSENAELRGLLKEQKSTECKEKASTDTSGNSSDGQADLRKSVETLQTESEGHIKVINLPKEVSDKETRVTTGLTVSATEGMESPPTKGQSHSKSAKQHLSKHGVSIM